MSEPPKLLEEPYVDARHGHIAEALARPINDIEDHIERHVCSADIFRPQL